MTEEPESELVKLLKQLRAHAGLTQEELAAKTGVDVRTISDLERGISHRPHSHTVDRLAGALTLPGPDRENFAEVARGRVWVRGVPGATRTLPPDNFWFTGRDPELRQLLGPAASAGGLRIHAIAGMAGVGKTTLAVHAAHQLAPQFPDGQLFVSLHGHTLGQDPVEPADALASLLQTAGGPAQHVPPDLAARVALWRDYLAGKKLLLILDDAIDSEQVRPLLPGTDESLVLVTSRRQLPALENTGTISLDTLSRREAASLLVRLAARPDLAPAHADVAEIAELCGHLPLAIRLVAAQLRLHQKRAVADQAAGLRAAQNRLMLMNAENLSVAVAFDLSYTDLTPGQRRLFRRLGLHPGTDIDDYVAAALDDSSLAAARLHLEGLHENSLLTEVGPGRYRLHDLIHERARFLGDTDPAPERDAALGRLLDYYLHTVRVAGRHLAQGTRTQPGDGFAVPRYAPDLVDRRDAIKWIDDERLNLQAVADYAHRNAEPGYAIAIAAAMHGFLRAQGHWDQGLALYQTAVEAARHSGDRRAEADALKDLGTTQRMTGNYQGAARSLGSSLGHYRALGDQRGEAAALNDLAAVQALTGDCPAAAGSLNRALGLYQSLGDQEGQAGTLTYLGAVQRLAGDYEASAASQTRAVELQRLLRDRLGEASALNDLGAVQRLTGDYPAALASQERSLELFRGAEHLLGQASALNDLGVIKTMLEDGQAAIRDLTEALGLYRQTGHLQGTANALNDLGAAQAATGDYSGATDSFDDAMKIYTGLGHRRGEAEVLNNRGEAELAAALQGVTGSRRQRALAIHRDALAIAVSLPAPAEEARAHEGIGRCQILTGDTVLGEASLRRALAIYQQISSPYAERVVTFLREHRLEAG